ncbi:META domain-containing protein [Streptomyces sp. S1D4-11]
MGRRSESACACTGPAPFSAHCSSLCSPSPRARPGRGAGKAPRTGPRRGPCRRGRAVTAGGSWAHVGGSTGSRSTGATSTHRRTAGAWVEFGYDNTAVGDYGCTPFKSSATVTATTLTVGTDTSGATPDDACPAKERAFEQRMRKIFTGGPLAVAERVDEFSMTLKNQRGDYVALQMLWPQGLFGAPWRIEYLNVADTPVDMTAGKEVYFVFHRDGTVTGKGGCNGFKGRAAFAGEHVTLYPLTRTTHRTCSRKIMSQEDGLLDQDPRTFSVVASRGITFVDRTPGLDGLAYNFIRVR